MNAYEFLGAVAGIFFSILCAVTAAVLGYEVLIIVLALPLGLAVGWAVGVAAAAVLIRVQGPPTGVPTREHNEKQVGPVDPECEDAEDPARE